jgi:hypothetical protein
MRLNSLTRGDTRLYQIVYSVDLTGATAIMTWRKQPTDADPGVLQIAGVLGSANQAGDILNFDFLLTKKTNEALLFEDYYVDFEITRSPTDIKTIKAKVKVTSGGG